MRSLKEKIIIILIVIAVLILLSVLINGIFLLKINVKQNNKIINLIENFQSKSPIVTRDKYQ